MLDLVVLSLAVFKVCEMVTQHDGPGQMFFFARVKLSIAGVAKPGSLGELLECMSCLSFWVALVLCWLPLVVLMPISAAGVATILQYAFKIGWTESDSAPPAA